ncbi:RNA exonuclease 5 [Carabus blaptoides fortunei]
MDPTQNLLSTKKLARLEKKKKKMLAFLEVAKLNEHDRVEKAVKLKAQLTDTSTSASSTASSDDEQPLCKKLKPDTTPADENICTDNAVNYDNNNKMAAPTIHKTPSGLEPLTGDNYIQLKKELRDRKNRLKNIPLFKLKSVGDSACISVSPEDRTPLFLSDVQHLLLYSMLGNHSPYFPQRWCFLEKYSKVPHTVILVLENLSLYHYTSNECLFPNLNQLFKNKFEVVTPSVYRGDLVEEIAAVPLTSTQKDKLIKEYGTLDKALQSSKVFNMLKAVFPVQVRIKHNMDTKIDLPKKDKFPRTHLLLSAWQLVEENYPLPLKGSLKHKYANYVLTKDAYEEVTPNSPMFGIDCEMCRTTTGELELTRISVVDENHQLVYEKLVKPRHRITDYLTRFSGITPKLLKDVTTRLEDVQRDLRELLPGDAILIGQSLNSDLHSLRMMHPYVIDTSVIFNVTGDRFRKTKLQILAREFLDETIQTSAAGHDSVEDSLSSLKLVQLKLEHCIEFGDAVLSGQQGCLRNYRNLGDNYYGSSLLHHVTKIDKNAAVFGQEETIKRYKNYIHQEECSKITCSVKETNKGVIRDICERVKQYNLSIAHVKLNESSLTDEHKESLVRNCTQTDKWIKKVWTHLSHSALCVVLFGGENGGNGACFIQVKKENN